MNKYLIESKQGGYYYYDADDIKNLMLIYFNNIQSNEDSERALFEKALYGCETKEDYIKMTNTFLHWDEDVIERIFKVEEIIYDRNEQ